jgi:hypothetical protein
MIRREARILVVEDQLSNRCMAQVLTQRFALPAVDLS